MCLCKEFSRTVGCSQKQNKKRKQNKQYMETLASFQMSVLLIDKQDVGVQSCCQLLQDHLSMHRLTLVMLGRPFFVFNISRSCPACSRKRSCTRDVDMEDCVHSSVGSGEQGPTLTLCSWDSRA